MRTRLTALLVCFLFVALAQAELRPPAQATAGTPFSIVSSGAGEGTFYLIGPAQISKRKVNGGEISVQGDEVEQAGTYTAILCADQCTAVHFYVRPAQASRLSLLVHPSRVPVAAPNAISAVAFVFDRFHNLVLSPQKVDFKVVPPEGAAISQSKTSANGTAWIRLTSARKGGPAKVGASIGDVAEMRVVQQVASDACNLRIKAIPGPKGISVETDPVRDCSGNFVPDGTVVSFTKTDSSGKTTVDAPIKRGVARVEMAVSGPARISVASGVVNGNELSLGGAR
ncbi:MAG TPA: hypothetical protein VK555_14105 [Terriglobales bacterium]|jgi:hypothetical protein|nr:hypothetical protein [Terriglobales bacterium]